MTEVIICDECGAGVGALGVTVERGDGETLHYCSLACLWGPEIAPFRSVENVDLPPVPISLDPAWIDSEFKGL